MAVTISRYNHTAKKLLNKEVDYAALKMMLLSNSATFAAANTQLTQVNNAGAYQVSGNGWPAGGPTLANVAITIVDTDGAMLDCDDVEINAVSAAIGPAYRAVIYDDTDANDAPLFFIDFGEAKQADAGTPFKITINASGLYRTVDPA